ncbi:MAG TPA: PHP-associated domain-containing protein, partial [bacterium]|nr:PHP-associated domain-containing protein [bacterium]
IRKKNVQSWNEYDIENIKGFEIYNAHNRTQANEFAVRWAQNKPITFTSGSDAHFSFEIGNALTLIEAENKSIAAIRDALGNRQTKPLNPVRNNHFIYLIIGILNKLRKNKYQYKSNSDIST